VLDPTEFGARGRAVEGTPVSTAEPGRCGIRAILAAHADVFILVHIAFGDPD